MLIPLAEYASRTRQDYNRALRRAMRGDVQGAERLGGRWYVPDSSIPAELEASRSAPSADVRAFQRLAAAFERRFLRPVTIRASAR